MVEKTKKSFRTIPKMKNSKQDYKEGVLKLEEIITEKPRASVKEIDETYKIIKMIDSQKKHAYSKKKKSRAR